MGQIKSRKPLLIGLIGILSLLGTGTAMWLTASFRHSSAVLQDQIETVPDLQISLSPEQLQSAQGFLDNMQTGKGFFAARYRGCFIQKDNKICQVFYPPKASEVNSATQRWNKAQLKLNKMGAGSRQKLTHKLLTQDKCEAPEFISALAFKL